MQRAGEHKHRAGLGGEARGRGELLVGERFGDMGRAAAVNPEHAIRHHAEIAWPGARDEMSRFHAVLDIEPDRAPVFMVHAGIHGEDQLAAGRGNLRGEAVEIRKRGAVGMGMEEGESGIVRREPADGEGLLLEADFLTGMRGRLPAHGQQQETCGQEKGAPHRARLARWRTGRQRWPVQSAARRAAQVSISVPTILE